MKEDLKHIVRIAATDLDGAKPLKQSLLKIKGVSHSMLNAVCNVSKINKDKKTGFLKEEEARKIEEIIKEPLKFKIPSWMVNREKDNDTGEDKHIAGVDLKLRKEFDIKKLMRVKSYRGLRLSVGLPTRGQKTKSNFRKNKRKGALGVKRKNK